MGPRVRYITAAGSGRGLAVFNQPLFILSLQTLWLALFLYFGWSKVTGAAMTFHVRGDRV